MDNHVVLHVGICWEVFPANIADKRTFLPMNNGLMSPHVWTGTKQALTDSTRMTTRLWLTGVWLAGWWFLYASQVCHGVKRTLGKTRQVTKSYTGVRTIVCIIVWHWNINRTANNVCLWLQSIELIRIFNIQTLNNLPSSLPYIELSDSPIGV